MGKKKKLAGVPLFLGPPIKASNPYSGRKTTTPILSHLPLLKMPRDMTGTGRYPPQPMYTPFAFYSCIRLGDPEQLAKVMDTDPYYITQDNGAGGPVHFATTYKQLDMLHHLLNNGAEVNQRDPKGWTPLHRAAYLAQYEGYMEIYEYLLSRGADPSIRTEDYDPYLNPGKKVPLEVAIDDADIRSRLKGLEAKYKNTKKERQPHEDIGDWWALYDYGLDTIKKWAVDYKHPYPEVIKRQKDEENKRVEKSARRERRAAALKEANVTLASNVPKTPIAFMFPGQGSQSIGMLKSCKDLPAVKELIATANRVLGYDILDICLNGPKTKLDNTIYSQPALLLAGLAGVEKLRKENPDTVSDASCCAGLSLGEYSALVFAGAISFEDALKIVEVRASSMAKAAETGKPHGMLSVVGLSDADLEGICKQVKQKLGKDTVCQIANYLFPQGRVVTGHKDALEEVQTLATSKGALKAQSVAVSGAFHSPLMQSAYDSLKDVIATVTIKAPRIPVYSNVLAKPFPSDPAKIGELLCRQLCEPVQWEGTLKTLISKGKNKLYELGPGAQIKAMTKRIDKEVWSGFTNVQP